MTIPLETEANVIGFMMQVLVYALRSVLPRQKLRQNAPDDVMQSLRHNLQIVNLSAVNVDLISLQDWTWQNYFPLDHGV